MTWTGRWKEFRADVGLPFGSRGSVKFGVYLDGKKLVETPVLKDGSSVPVKAAVEGGRKLEIRVDDAGDGQCRRLGHHCQRHSDPVNFRSTGGEM